jgi:hypothetical protein
VDPAEAAAVPTCARSADTTVPKPRLEFPKIGVASKLTDNSIDRLTEWVPRRRDIFVSKRAVSRIAATLLVVNL